MPQPFDQDATIRLTRPLSSPVRARRPAVWAAVTASVLLVALAAGGGWLVWKSPSVPRVTPPSPSAPARTQTPLAAVTIPPPAAERLLRLTPQASPVLAPLTVPATPETGGSSPAQSDFVIQTANEAQILDHVPLDGAPDPAVFRFRPNPRILVLDFASLRDQGRMLNRIAALAEKSGLPHDRLLSDDALEKAIRAGGDTVETFYYGHDYGARELLRFFTLGDRDNVQLVPEEDELRRLIRQEGWFEPNARAALISIPQVGADEHVTRPARATILHHELSHGEYFTNPAYAAFVHGFWTRALTATERDRIRQELHSLGYDSSLEEVMENEAQAYLMFTDSPEFFTPAMIGMSKPRLTELREAFFRAMPAGWLRDSLGATLTESNTAVTRP